MYIDIAALSAFVGAILGAFTLYLVWLFLYHGIQLFKSWTPEKPYKEEK